MNHKHKEFEKEQGLKITSNVFVTASSKPYQEISFSGLKKPLPLDKASKQSEHEKYLRW